MKEAIASTPPVEQSNEPESFANRKLIRPTLPRNDHNQGNHSAGHAPAGERRERPERHERMERHDRGDRALGGGKKTSPPEQTNAENFYYQKQMQGKTPMVVVLKDGEEIRGVIEWYDRNCLKLIREGSLPNVMVYKPAIKYMYKEGENGR
jgi:sRNA-binding regulator protein Hfq